jgi:hypothetical protein
MLPEALGFRGVTESRVDFALPQASNDEHFPPRTLTLFHTNGTFSNFEDARDEFAERFIGLTIDGRGSEADAPFAIGRA